MTALPQQHTVTAWGFLRGERGGGCGAEEEGGGSGAGRRSLRKLTWPSSSVGLHHCWENCQDNRALKYNNKFICSWVLDQLVKLNSGMCCTFTIETMHLRKLAAQQVDKNSWTRSCVSAPSKATAKSQICPSLLASCYNCHGKGHLYLGYASELFASFVRRLLPYRPMCISHHLHRNSLSISQFVYLPVCTCFLFSWT